MLNFRQVECHTQKKNKTYTLLTSDVENRTVPFWLAFTAQLKFVVVRFFFQASDRQQFGTTKITVLI